MTRRPVLLFATAAVLAAGVSVAWSAWPSSPPSPFQRLRLPTGSAVSDDTSAVTLGVKFIPSIDGYVTGVEFRRDTMGNLAREVQLWNSTGKQLATSSQTPHGTGLVQQLFGEPVPVKAGAQYVASYFAPAGRYNSVEQARRKPQTSGPLTAPANAGVYDYQTEATYPTQTWESSDYQVTPLFVANLPGAPRPSSSTSSRSSSPRLSEMSPTSAVAPTTSPTLPPIAEMPPNPEAYRCVRTDAQGKCFYPAVPYITGTSDNPYLNQNIWAAAGDPTYKQSLFGRSPRDWYVSVNANTRSGGVKAFPNVGWNMAGVVDAMPKTVTSWSVDFPHDGKIIAWAAYDLWLNDWADEVMIQVDISANERYDCQNVASATFGGRPWHMCRFGAERVWKPGMDDGSIRNEPIGFIEVKQFLVWMEDHGHLPRNSTWTAGSFGFEPCDTGGVTAKMKVTDFSWLALAP